MPVFHFSGGLHKSLYVQVVHNRSLSPFSHLICFEHLIHAVARRVSAGPDFSPVSGQATLNAAHRSTLSDTVYLLYFQYPTSSSSTRRPSPAPHYTCGTTQWYRKSQNRQYGGMSGLHGNTDAFPTRYSLFSV